MKPCTICREPLTETDALPGSLHSRCALAASISARAPRAPQTDAEHCRAMAAVLSEVIASDRVSIGLRSLAASAVQKYQDHVKARRAAEATATISQSEGSA